MLYKVIALNKTYKFFSFTMAKDCLQTITNLSNIEMELITKPGVYTFGLWPSHLCKVEIRIVNN